MNRLMNYLVKIRAASLLLIVSGVLATAASAQYPIKTLKGKPFNNITLETSLKPFKVNDPVYIQKVCSEIFKEWYSLLRHTDTVSVMLWTGDGSEILDYRGNLDQPLEWAKYMGNPNTDHPVGSGPKSLSLHERALLYIPNPPNYTYGDLKFIIKTLKETGEKITGKPVRIGATFDPGPEFAKSDFKYKRHREILGGSSMGKNTFVSCYSVLNPDTVTYAGYPRGIPANTPFGTFFGRQSQHFLHDLGYDYLWLSNGFGFGVEGWSSTGAIFTGNSFKEDKLPIVKKEILDFWKLFRAECPSYRIETRGTNLSTGTDLARDGVVLKDIYEGGFNLLPPPNSPWAAIDGDFGLEMTGYMSRIAEIPDNRYLFRYYTHDPWWVNSPWFDRYGSEPHDIYLPMAVARIDSAGTIENPTNLNFLTIDNSYGDMPAEVPDEVTPHILKARYDEPTAPGPVVWVYPFDEYHKWAATQPNRLPEIYYGDWFIRQAINNGFPVNTVISTTGFSKLINKQQHYFDGSVLLSVAPDAGSALESALIQFVKKGGKLIIYGPVDHSGKSFLQLLNLKNEEALQGRFQIQSNFKGDKVESSFPKEIEHRALFSGGGIRTDLQNTADANTKVEVQFEQGGKKRSVVWVRSNPAWAGGKVVYVRGTNSSSFTGGKLLQPDDPQKLFTGGIFLRYALQEFGINYHFIKQSPAIKNPILTVANSNNGFYFSGYVPNTTVVQQFKFPDGAPIFDGYQTELKDGNSTYELPTAWHRECRVFIKQQNGIVSCKELPSGEKDISRRLQVTGLDHATVTIYPEEKISKDNLNVYLNAHEPWKTGKISFQEEKSSHTKCYVVKNVSGQLVISW
ncbi:MAG: hypothetical protein ACTHJN_01075 [Ginsengibacter sp.]